MNHITDNFINITATKNSTIPIVVGKFNCAFSINIVDRTVKILNEAAGHTCNVYIKSPNNTL